MELHASAMMWIVSTMLTAKSELFAQSLGVAMMPLVEEGSRWRTRAVSLGPSFELCAWDFLCVQLSVCDSFSPVLHN